MSKIFGDFFLQDRRRRPGRRQTRWQRGGGCGPCGGGVAKGAAQALARSSCRGPSRRPGPGRTLGHLRACRADSCARAGRCGGACAPEAAAHIGAANDDDKASVARRGSPERIEKVEICCVMMWERGRGAVRAVVQLGSWNVDQPRRGGTRWLGRSTSAPSDGHSSTVRAS